MPAKFKTNARLVSIQRKPAYRIDLKDISKLSSGKGENMEPMKPMEPMEPMKPMSPIEKWWPDDLGDASSSGSQNGVRYAYFSNEHRLVIEENGTLHIYDSGSHQISGVSQQQSDGRSLAFTSQIGTVKVGELKKIS